MEEIELGLKEGEGGEKKAGERDNRTSPPD